MGRYSYGIYLFHQVIAFVTGDLLMQGLRDHVASKAILHLTVMAINVGITIPLAMASFEYFEKPFLRLKRFFNYAHSQSSALES